MIENVKVLQVDTTKSVQSVKDLRQAMKELDDSFIAGKISEEEFMEQTKTLESRMFALTDAHADAKLSINDFGVQLKNVGKAGTSITNALAGVSAGMKLLGVDSEDLVSHISKLQDLSAIAQAFGVFKDDGVKAFKAIGDAVKKSTAQMSLFKKALISTGIGALIVAIGLLIANFEDINAWIVKVTGGALDLTKVFSGLKGIFSNLGATLKSFGNLLLQYLLAPIRTVIDASVGLSKIFTNLFKGNFDQVKEEALNMGKDILGNFTTIGDAAVEFGHTVADGYRQGVAEGEKKAAEEHRKQLQEQLSSRKNQLDAELEYLKSTHSKEWASSEEFKNRMKGYYSELTALYKEAYGEDSLEYKKLLAQRNSYFRDFISNEEQAAKDAAEKEQTQAKETAEKREQLLKKLSDYQKGAYQAELDNLTAKFNQELILLEGNLEAQNVLREKYEEERLSLANKYRDKEDEARRKHDEEAREEILARLAENNMTDVELAISQLNEKYALEQELFAENEEILTQLEQEYVNKRKEIEREASLAKTEMAIKGTTTIANEAANILDQFASKQDTTTREGFEQSKKLQIASATIQMLTGIVTAISGAFTTKTGPWDIAIAAIQAASIAAAGAININKIKQQTFNGGSTASAQVPSINTTSAADVLNRSVNTRSIVSDSEAKENVSAVKVYVTESDISSTVKKVSVTESENSF